MRAPNPFKQLHSRKPRRPRRLTPTIDGLEPRELLSLITPIKVADISTKIPTLIPGKDYGNFISVNFSVIDGTDIAFYGTGNNGLQGIYLSSNGGSPRTVVDTDTIVSNVSGGGFRMFGDPSLSHGIVAFIGYSKIANDTATTGIYYVDMASPGVVHTVVDTTMTAPNTIDSFGMFQVAPSISGKNISFEADRHNPLTQHWQTGIYLYDGQNLHTLADENIFKTTDQPNTRFAVSGSPIVGDSGDVAFPGNYYDLEWSEGNGWLPGSAYNQGIYVYSHDTGQVTPAVSTSTAIPNWDGHHFEYFQNLNFADGVIAFNDGLGYTEPANGIYSNASGTWQHVVGALMSDVSGTMFTGIGPSSIDHGNMVFVGVTGGYSTNYGIYAKVGNEVPVKILQKGDSLDNQTVWSVYIGNHSLSGQAIVMNVQFSDSALSAIYEAVDTEMASNNPPVAVAGWTYDVVNDKGKVISQGTGFRAAETTVQKAIVAAANAAKGQPSGQSVTNGPWYTDMYSDVNGKTDGTRIREAINIYDTWSRAPKKIRMTLDQIKQEMYGILDTYSSSDQEKLVQRIIQTYKKNSNVPANDQATLSYLGIQKQCLEWADTIAQNAGGTPTSYKGAAIVTDPSQYRPGMGLFMKNESHAMIIVNIRWDAAGKPVEFQVAEANYATKWSNPIGQIPWKRTVSVGRKVAVSDAVEVVTFES